MASLCDINYELAQFSYSLSNMMNSTHQIHCHSVYEIYYFVEGDVDYLVEGNLYRPAPNSILLLSPHVFHGVKVRSDNPYRRFTLHFHPDLLQPDRRQLLLTAFPSNDKHTRREVYYEKLNGTQLGSFFEALKNLAEQSDPLKQQLLPTYIEAILAQLTIICQTQSPVQVEARTSQIITDIIAYLNDHLTEHITLDQLSEHFNISKHYMNRAFRKAAGTTVFDYLIYKRIIFAKQLMINGSTAAEAARRSGFRDYTVFYRAYRKHLGHSPVEDRSFAR